MWATHHLLHMRSGCYTFILFLKLHLSLLTFIVFAIKSINFKKVSSNNLSISTIFYNFSKRGIKIHKKPSFLWKKTKEKNCKDLSVSGFSRICKRSLKSYILKIKQGYFKNFDKI
jgi:hypothetical protein